MKKIALMLIAVLFISISFAFAQEEKITISTYYPSPFGVYNELQLFPHSQPVTPCDAAHEGTMYFDSDDHMLYVCGCREGICRWNNAGGLWTTGTGANANDIYNTNTGNVGVGTATPAAKLDVNGNLNFDGQKYCMVDWAAPDFNSVANSHGHNIMVPASWTKQDCINYAWDRQGHGGWKIRVGVMCAFKNGKSSMVFVYTDMPESMLYGHKVDINSVPSPNCGW